MGVPFSCRNGHIPLIADTTLRGMRRLVGVCPLLMLTGS
jgi:hypothetical protein